MKQLNHPLVGELTLSFEALELPADPGLSLGTYAAEPGTVSAERFRELERWAATRATLVVTNRAGRDVDDEATAGA